MSNLLEFAKGLNYSGNFSLGSTHLFRGELDGISPELISSLSNQSISKEILKPVINNPISPIKNESSLLDAARAGKMRINIDSPKGLFNKINDKLDSAGNKINESGIGKFTNKMGSAIGTANGLAKAANTMFHGHRTGLQKTDEGALEIRDAQYSVLKKIPVTAPFAKAAELLDNTLGAITGGLGSATKADKVLTALPLLGNTAAIFAGKTDTFKGNIQDINTGDFGGTVSDSTIAQDMSGVKSVAKKKLNNQIRSAQHDFNLASDIVDFNKLRMNNNIGQDLQSAMLSKYQGNQQLTLAKKGTKFPDLESARSILNSIKSKDIQSFKSGGKIEKENIIPTGALHKNLHHIDDIGIDITKKGIPVVTMDEGGEFKDQIAEVEAAEWTLSLDVTKHIEEYWNNYKESDDDDIAIECGKYLVDQIFNNTRDDDKVIKKTE